MFHWLLWFSRNHPLGLLTGASGQAVVYFGLLSLGRSGMGLVVGSFGRCHREGQGPKVILSGGSIQRRVVGVEIKRLGLLGTSQIVVPCHFLFTSRGSQPRTSVVVIVGVLLELSVWGPGMLLSTPQCLGCPPPTENDPTSMSAVPGVGGSLD